MFRFTRTVVLKDSSVTPKAMEVSMKIKSILKEKYDLELGHGVELFGSPRIHWWFETPSLDAVTEINAKLMGDKDYMGLVSENSPLWVEGSLQDTIVKVM